MPTTQSKVRNWREYNKSLKKRGTIIFSFSPDIIKLYYFGKQQRGGVRKYSDNMYEYMLSIKVLLRLPWRATEGCVKMLLQKAFPEHQITIPNYAHASREAGRLKLKIRQYLPQAKDGMELVLDSTGVNVYTTSGWHHRRYNKDCLYRKREQWKKIHIVMDLDSMQIISAAYTESNINDCEVIGQLFEGISGKIKNIRADGAYDTEEMYRVAERCGAKVIIPPAKTSKAQDELINKPKDKKRYLEQRDNTIKMIRGYDNFDIGLSNWKIASNYHRRSLIEATMFRLKKTFGFYLQHKSEQGRINEIIAKMNILNQMASYGRAQYSTI